MGEFLGVGRVQHPRHFHHPVQHLAVVHPHDVIAARNAHLFQRIGQHGANLGIRRHRGTAHRIGIALVELAEAARTRLFVAPDRTHRIAPIRAGQIVAELGGNPCQRGSQVIAQRQPVAVFVLPAEDAFVGTVDIGQELAQRLDRFHGRCFQRVKTVAVIDRGNGIEHRLALCHIRAKIVAEPFGRFRLWPPWCFFARHAASPAVVGVP